MQFSAGAIASLCGVSLWQAEYVAATRTVFASAGHRGRGDSARHNDLREKL